MILALILVDFLISAFSFSSVPALPSSFYGTVTVNHSTVPDGTLIEAFIGGKPVGSASTQTVQSASVYAIDIPCDDTDTSVQDGGYDGDVIRFRVGGLWVEAQGIWHSGTNVELDLVVSSASTLKPPQATPSDYPSQTPIKVTQKVEEIPVERTLTIEEEEQTRIGATSTLSSEESIEFVANTTSTPIVLHPTKVMKSTPLPEAAIEDGSQFSEKWMTLIIIFASALLGIILIFWYFKKFKAG